MEIPSGGRRSGMSCHDVLCPCILGVAWDSHSPCTSLSRDAVAQHENGVGSAGVCGAGVCSAVVTAPSV